MITLNEFIYIAFTLGTIINALAPTWQFKWRDFIANVLIVGTAWAVTEYFITKTPSTDWGQFLYIVGCLVLGFAPITIYRVLTGEGFKVFKNYAETKAQQLIEKNKTVKTTETTETTITKETDEPKP